MKVLQVNVTYNKGSTGKIVYDIHTELKKNTESVVCYGRGKRITDSSTYRISNEVFSKINALYTYFTGYRYNGSNIATKKLKSIIEFEKPDIVHLHCLNGYFVNIYKILDFLKKSGIKTVLTLHAEFMYTGGCGCSFECNKWMTGCGNCYKFKSPLWQFFYGGGQPLFDKTSRQWRMMYASFKGFDNLIIVSVSGWLNIRAKQSPILANKNHFVVLNGIETKEVFHPCEYEYLKKKHGLSNEKILLHVTASFTDEIKGGKYIIELAQSLINENIKIIVVGNTNKNLVLPQNIIDIGRINNQNKLASYYSMADLTIITSKRETFSMVCAESLSCGTPVVGFKAGAPEQISIGDYSEFVEYGDMDKLLDCINKWIDKKVELTDKLAKIASAHYSKENMVKKYLSVYKMLMSKEL